MDRPFLVGEKVYLKPFEKKYIDQGYGDLVNDRNIIKYLPSSFYPKTDSNLENYIDGCENDGSLVFMAIFSKEDDTYIGNLKIKLDWISRVSSYTRLLTDKCWGKGYGSDLLYIVMVYSFNIVNMRILQTYVNASNVQSVKSNLKTGMKQTAILEDFEFLNGKYHDLIRFSMTKNEFEKLRQEEALEKIVKMNSVL